MHHYSSLHEAFRKNDYKAIHAMVLDGFDINEQDEEGNTLLHLLAKSDVHEPHFQFIELLLLGGASPILRNNDNKLAAELIYGGKPSNISFEFNDKRNAAIKTYIELVLNYCPTFEVITAHLEAKLIYSFQIRVELLPLDCLERLKRYSVIRIAKHKDSLASGVCSMFSDSDGMIGDRLISLAKPIENELRLLNEYPGLPETIKSITDPSVRNIIFRALALHSDFASLFNHLLDTLNNLPLIKYYSVNV